MSCWLKFLPFTLDIAILGSTVIIRAEDGYDQPTHSTIQQSLAQRQLCNRPAFSGVHRRDRLRD